MRTATVVAAASLALAAAYVVNPSTDAVGAETTPPNIVFIMLDDVSTGYMDAMPYTAANIGGKGVEFDVGITPTSLCCPSRAATLSGKLAHTTGVYSNTGKYGGWSAFKSQESDTIATHLNDAGYTTALFGKYLNGFKDAPTGYVPAGWDRFEGFRATGYYDWSLGGTVEESYGTGADNYSTDVLTAKAVQFVNDEVGKDNPFFLYYSPYAAHTPMIAAPRHKGTWHNEPLDAAFNEKDMSDKARFMQKKRKVGKPAAFKTVQRKQHEMLMSVDEGVQQIMDAVGNERDNTLFVLMGDNGYLLGAHRLTGKNFPYVRAAQVPMMLRLDGVIDSSIAGRLTTNTDLTATMAEVAGASWPMDGMSVLSEWREGTVMEQIRSEISPGLETTRLRFHPPYCGYRTTGWLFVHWNNQKREELYRYSTDPSELDNLAIKKRWNSKQKEMRNLAKQACSPVPPGFGW
jgi:N-acetylglucosamine-6-sulfatase